MLSRTAIVSVEERAKASTEQTPWVFEKTKIYFKSEQDASHVSIVWSHNTNAAPQSTTITMSNNTPNLDNNPTLPARNPLETVPTVNRPNGNIPNTPLAVSTISFLLGAVFCSGTLTFLVGGFSVYWWSTYQLGFFVAAWSAFHWGEFAVTAGWNFEKCSVDCKRIHSMLGDY